MTWEEIDRVAKLCTRNVSPIGIRQGLRDEPFMTFLTWREQERDRWGFVTGYEAYYDGDLFAKIDKRGYQASWWLSSDIHEDEHCGYLSEAVWMVEELARSMIPDFPESPWKMRSWESEVTSPTP